MTPAELAIFASGFASAWSRPELACQAVLVFRQANTSRLDQAEAAIFEEARAYGLPKEAEPNPAGAKDLETVLRETIAAYNAQEEHSPKEKDSETARICAGHSIILQRVLENADLPPMDWAWAEAWIQEQRKKP